MVIYLTGPLESNAEKTFMAALAKDLESAGHTLSWPGARFPADSIEALGDSAPDVIADACRTALKGCACMVAVLDGTHVDSGTAWEIGHAHAHGVPVYGLRAETLRAGDVPPTMGNSVVHGCLEGLAPGTPVLLGLLSEAAGPCAVAREAGRRG